MFIVLYGNDLTVAGDHGRFHSDTFTADDADGVLIVQMQLIDDDGADLARHVADRTLREVVVLHANPVGTPGIRIEDQHDGRAGDLRVDHLR